MRYKPWASLSAVFSVALVCVVAALSAASLQTPSQLTGKQLFPKIEQIYQAKPMLSSYKDEDTRIVDHGVLIHYMSNEERESARVVIVNGTLYTSTGQPTPYGSDHEKLNYAMDAAGNFYVLNQMAHPDLRHSSFFDGRPAACAGDLEVKNGRIVKINSNSGHYSPSAKMFRNVLTELKRDGVDLRTLSLPQSTTMK